MGYVGTADQVEDRLGVGSRRDVIGAGCDHQQVLFDGCELNAAVTQPQAAGY